MPGCEKRGDLVASEGEIVSGEGGIHAKNFLGNGVVAVDEDEVSIFVGKSAAFERALDADDDRNVLLKRGEYFVEGG